MKFKSGTYTCFVRLHAAKRSASNVGVNAAADNNHKCSSTTNLFMTVSFDCVMHKTHAIVLQEEGQKHFFKN